MMPDQHPDPVGEAAQVAVRATLQYGALVAGAARSVKRRQVLRARLRLEREERVRRVIQAQERAERAAARARWAPANDSRWLRGAGLIDTAAAWCAAVPFADRGGAWFEEDAAAAVRNCEQRLRDLHPHAMARYDRLRQDGLDPVDAMRAAAPLFARSPRVHDQGAVFVAALPAGSGVGEAWTLKVHGPSREEFDGAVRAKRDARGQRIAQRLLDGDSPVVAEELRARLEASTNLPLDVIDAIVPADPSIRAGCGAAGARRSGRPWQDDFPFPISTVIAARAGRAADGTMVGRGVADRRDERDRVRRTIRR